MRKNIALHFISCVVGAGLVAGCGTTSNTSGSGPANGLNGVNARTSTPSNTTNTTNTTTATNATTATTATNATTGRNPSLVISALIQQAMQAISAKTTVPLYAPTTYPGAVHTPLPVTVQTNTSSSPVPNYSLLFNRNNSNIGEIAVYDWSTPTQAAAHLLPRNKSLYADPSLSAVSEVNLGTGISAKTEQLPIQGKQISALVWNEGRWTMEVLYPTNAQGKAVSVAKGIVQYCHSNFLPAPDSKGYVLSSLTSGNVNTYVSWNKGQYVFNSSSEGTWNSNLSGGYLSALQMAVSMQPYNSH